MASRDKATTNMEADWYFGFSGRSTVTRTDASNKAELFTPQYLVWHTPSEHTINGKHFAAEAQIISMDGERAVAITSFFFDNVDQDVGGDNDFVQNFLEGYADRFNPDKFAKKYINMDKIMKKLSEANGLNQPELWQYDGSLTTPPCTEGVKWTIYKTVQPISDSQLATFWQFTKGTASGNAANETEPQYLEFM